MAAPALGRRHRTFTAPFQGNAHHPRIRRGSHPEILIRPYPDFARLRPDCPGPGTEGRARWPRHEFLVLPTRTCGFGRTGGADRTEWPGLGWSGWGYGPWLGVAPPPRWGNRPGLSRTRRLRCRTLERTCCATGVRPAGGRGGQDRVARPGLVGVGLWPVAGRGAASSLGKPPRPFPHLPPSLSDT